MKIEQLPVINQEGTNYCVSIVATQMMRLLYNSPELDWEWLGWMSDVADKQYNDGTYPLKTFEVLKAVGCPPLGVKKEVSADIFKLSFQNPIAGFNIHSNSFQSIKTAIDTIGCVGIGLPSTLLLKGLPGRHYILAYGYDEKKKTIKFRNSWGKSWGNNGNGEIAWTSDMRDVITLTPREVSYTYFSKKEVEKYKLLPELWAMLDRARGLAGVPFSINSGKRTTAQNKKVGGVSDSAHLTGEAVDIKCTNSEQRYAILKGLMEAGFTRIGLGKTFVHADISKTLHQNLIWFY